MSTQVLNQLLDAHGFDGSPLHVDMRAYHVAFDDRGRSGCESAMVRAAQSTERIAVQGPIGCGKTSVLRYALDDPSAAIAPIWVSVAFDDDQVVLDVRRFAAHLIQSIIRDAERAGTLNPRERDAILAASAARRPLPGSERRLASRLAATFWVATAGLSKEVSSTLAGVDLQRPAGQVLENVNRALEAIAAADRRPVIVVDDSDSFTRRLGGSHSRDELVAGFFGPVLRSLTELHAGVIVAVHDEYLGMPAFDRARREHGALERLIAVPPVVSGQLARILDRRIRLTVDAGREHPGREHPGREHAGPEQAGREQAGREQAGREHALTDGAVEALAELNRTRTGRNLRTTLGIAHAALVAAVDRGADLIEAQDVARAAVEQLGS